jgi:hypothetical protein
VEALHWIIVPFYHLCPSLFIIVPLFIYIYRERERINNTWVRGNNRFISSVEHDISQVSAANEKELDEKVCGKLKFEAILGKFIFGCGSTD